MSARNRVFVGLLFVYALGVGFVLYRVVADLDQRYRESAEESLVDTAYVVASLVERDVRDGTIDAEAIARVMRIAYGREIDARIFDLVKTRVELRVTVTDRFGRVVYDSVGRPAGTDLSTWRDIRLTLDGRYGARTTPDVAGDSATAVMYVGAPIRANGEIIGVASVGKPTRTFGEFVDAARRRILWIGAGALVAFIVLALLVSVWLVRPFGLVRDFVVFVAQQRPSLPRAGRRALGSFGAAFGEMRDALAGRSYVGDYVQTLTHELKSPVSAIRGAAELLQESLPEADRQRFAHNIAHETHRIQEIVDRMLELATLQARRGLDVTAPVAMRGLVDEIAQHARATGAARRVGVRVAPGDDALVDGDAFLLRRAITNLVDNAIDFSPGDSEVVLVLVRERRTVRIEVHDVGPGLPEYAAERLFEKFYSLPRPHSGKKGTGLGLAFVREIAGLHRGRAEVRNRSGGGAIATLTLPRLRD